tara:strand:- start:343 stop:483 length:141 start_codon:yes stop_codon:yes gene_type:complete
MGYKRGFDEIIKRNLPENLKVSGKFQGTKEDQVLGRVRYRGHRLLC